MSVVFGLLVLVFLVVPILELYVIVQVSSSIGVLETIGLLVLVSVVGAWLVRHEGLGVLGRVQAQLARGHVPGRDLVDGLLILFAGALMLTPGFFTDALGLVLLLPPTRAIVRTMIIRRFRGQVVVGGTPSGFGGRFGSGRFGGDFDDVVEVDDDEPPHAPPPIELGP